MKVVIDTDPAMGVLGSDPEDAFAISYCLNSSELDVAGVTVVNGNVPADLAYRNARYILDLHDAGHIPLAVGPTRPIGANRPDVLAWQNMRRGQPIISPPVATMPRIGAPQQLVDTILAGDEPTTVLAIGPLTNLAMAVLLEPEITQRVQRIVLMGGKGRIGGNVTPEAEFNFWCDPDAAAIVLNAGWPITMVTLEVCHQTRMTRDRFDAVTIQTPFGKFAAESCAPWFDRHPDERDIGFPLFDSLAAAVLSAPELITTVPALVEVDTSSGPAAGADACWLGHDVLGRPLATTNVELSVAVDAEAFLDRFSRRVLDRL